MVANMVFLKAGDGERFRPLSALFAEGARFFLNRSGVPKNFLFSSAIETNLGLFTTVALDGHSLSAIWAAFSLLI